MPQFRISQSEFELESKFEPRLWSLYHGVPGLYEALLHHLAPFDISASDLKFDPGDGSIGGGGVSIWLFGFRATLKLKLESFNLRCTDLNNLPKETATRIIDGVRSALAQASQKSVSTTGQTLMYASHGQLDGIKAAEFIHRFVPVGPSVASFGEPVGSGSQFYYGAKPPVLSSVITIDPSRAIEGGLFVRVVLVLGSTAATAADLVKLGEDRINDVFSALGLEGTAPWS